MAQINRNDEDVNWDDVLECVKLTHDASKHANTTAIAAIILIAAFYKDIAATPPVQPWYFGSGIGCLLISIYLHTIFIQRNATSLAVSVAFETSTWWIKRAALGFWGAGLLGVTLFILKNL